MKECFDLFEAGFVVICSGEGGGGGGLKRKKFEEWHLCGQGYSVDRTVCI